MRSGVPYCICQSLGNADFAFCSVPGGLKLCNKRQESDRKVTGFLHAGLYTLWLGCLSSSHDNEFYSLYAHRGNKYDHKILPAVTESFPDTDVVAELLMP